ncbi:hypothetical protein K140096H11_23990 [Bacteroides intestinalis]
MSEELNANRTPFIENSHAFAPRIFPAIIVPTKINETVINSGLDGLLLNISHSNNRLNHVNCIRMTIANDAEM